MFVDMGQITAENYEEFYARTAVQEKLSGAYLTETDAEGNHKPRYITLKDVRDHIGLSTNVSFLKRAQWLKRVMDYQMRDIVERAKMREKREAEKAEQPAD